MKDVKVTLMRFKKRIKVDDIYIYNIDFARG